MTPDPILADPMWLAFQATLDEHPDSSECRLVLADELDNIGHPWGEAYRWLGVNGKRPQDDSGTFDWWYEVFKLEKISATFLSHSLDSRIFEKLAGYLHKSGYDGFCCFVEYPTRLAAEFAFCRAYVAVQKEEELAAVRAEVRETAAKMAISVCKCDGGGTICGFCRDERDLPLLKRRERELSEQATC